jgi:hypothetical protein
MVSLIKSMKWDEEVFGLEYDLVRGGGWARRWGEGGRMTRGARPREAPERTPRVQRR